MSLPEIPISCEASPATVDPGKLNFLRSVGVERLSVGVQSFVDRETGALGRPQKEATLVRALDWIREAGFPVLNLDLIYGAEGQSAASWRRSLDRALDYRPEEIYLYPLYVRPLTGLGRTEPIEGPWRLDRRGDESERHWDEHRLRLYRIGRDYLLERGYRQLSMRMFRAAHAPPEAGPAYRCQEDGMLGLGCGARSYTRRLHYSQDYAVNARAVLAILQSYLQRSLVELNRVEYGYELDGEDERRRYALLSLLQAEGLPLRDYRRRFAAEATADLPQLSELVEDGWATSDGRVLRLTAAGMERSDAIGPWLYSERVRRRMEQHQWR